MNHIPQCLVTKNMKTERNPVLTIFFSKYTFFPISIDICVIIKHKKEQFV